MQAEQKRSKDQLQSTPLKVAQEVYEESGIKVIGVALKPLYRKFQLSTNWDLRVEKLQLVRALGSLVVKSIA